MPCSDANRNLLFGFLALQMDLVTREGLIAALSAWVVDKSQGLGAILLGQGALVEGELTLLEGLVDAHLRKHGGDAGQSLAALQRLGSEGRAFEEVDDPDLHASLRQIGSASTEESLYQTRVPAPGEVPLPTAARFQVLRPLCKGGLGVLSIALDSELNREIALKEVRDEHADDPWSRSRFLAEAEVTGGLEHPGIVPIYGLGKYLDGRPYYAMKLIRGESLKEAIARYHGAEQGSVKASYRALAFRKLLRRFLNVCEAIDYAHGKGVIHRDLKPSNIMLGPHGETLVIDWGLAKRIGHPDSSGGCGPDDLRPSTDRGDHATVPGSAIGTPAFMSPEQAAGDLDRLGPACDIYSLGATLYCLLTGRPPFEDGVRADVDGVLRRVMTGDFPPLRSLDPTVSPTLQAICARAMALRPECRHTSAGDLANDIEQWLADEPLSAYREVVDRYKALVEEDPDRPSYREGLARGRTDLSLALRVLGRESEALTVQREAISDYLSLASNCPQVTSFREGLANGYSNLGRILMGLGLESEAKDAFRLSFTEYERLVRAAPRALDYRTNLGDLMVSLGRSADDILQTIGRLPTPAIEPTPDAETGGGGPAKPLLPDSLPTGLEWPSRDGPIESATTFDKPLDGPNAAATGGSRRPEPPRAEFGFRYEILRLVGRGGLGKVWLVHDRDLHRDVVLKELHADDTKARRWFLREAQITSQLQHPAIVPVYDLGRSQSGQPFYTMKFVQGHTFYDLVKEIHTGRLPEDAPAPLRLRPALDIFLRVCEAMDYSHARGILHRDLKPANILIGSFGEVCISDWGLAKIVGQDGDEARGDAPFTPSDGLMTLAGSVIGTPAYMAPEQAMGAQVDFRTDVYGLGATLFHALTGRPPHLVSGNVDMALLHIIRGVTPFASPAASWFPPALDAICTRAMAFSPEERYPTPGLLAKDVRRWLAGESAPAGPDREVPWYRRLVRRGFGRQRGPLSP